MMGNQGYTQSPTIQMRIPILCFIERMADHRCNIGTFHMFRKWQRNHTPRISTLIPPINKPTIMPNKEIPNNHLHISRRRISRPSYPHPNDSVYSPNSTTASYIIPTHHLESIYNIQRCSFIRRNFHHSPILATTCLTPSHPVQIDIPPVKNFTSKFTHHSSWTTNSMYHLIH